MGHKRRRRKVRRKGHKGKDLAENEKGSSKARPWALSPLSFKLLLSVGAILTLIVFAAIILAPAPKDTSKDDIVHDHPPLILNRAPVAKAAVTPAVVQTNEMVTLDGSRSFDMDQGDRIINYTWEVHQDWIDGNIIQRFYGRKINRSFSEPGAVYIVLIVTDTHKATNSTVKGNPYGGATVMVNNRIPVAVAGEDQAVHVDEDIYLDAGKSHDDDGDIVDYLWDLGDGNTSNGPFVTHKYQLLGSYTITLTVKDDHGAIGTDTVTVIVQ